MCNTQQHRIEDTILLEATRPPLDLLRDHPYDDECCLLVRPHDGRPELRHMRESWRDGARRMDQQLVAMNREPGHEANLDGALTRWMWEHVTGRPLSKESPNA